MLLERVRKVLTQAMALAMAPSVIAKDPRVPSTITIGLTAMDWFTAPLKPIRI